MGVSVKTDEYKPFGKCVIISNGDAEAIITADVGPRIISYRAFGGESFLFADKELQAFTDDSSIKAAYGKERYYFFGGHRLWWTPERLPETYCPDDEPVSWKRIPNGASFVPKEQPSGVQLSFEFTMEETGAAVHIAQKVTNTSNEIRRHAAWGVTQCRAGGIALSPQNTRQCSPLPNRSIVFWPYTDMRDSRFLAADRYITLIKSGEAQKSFKFGYNNEASWCGYLIEGQMLYKRFEFDAAAKYPDYGCNYEAYTDSRSLEIESLGAELDLAPGESATLNERWSVLNVPAGMSVPDRSTIEFADMIDGMVRGV